ncbi:hypothetical protein EJ08DRAFT_630491 [Tothia fuscella]|uniref:Calcium channel YVC1-like C-terminal transmembrane domain-containing protein n=1 Tax=Tothia fuscella TaxID=1048955 RepID=A0A9P4NVT6_9PEZI|nr:hypothetical protein EJ08DRAFT_630491 [Tothia fuscella]
MTTDRSENMSPSTRADHGPAVPNIDEFDSFTTLLRKLNSYFVEAVQSPRKFEDNAKSAAPLVESLADDCQNKAVVHAILALKMHFSAMESDEDRGLNESRGYACEYAAWRFVSHLSGREAIDYLLYELPRTTVSLDSNDEESANPSSSHERSPLLRQNSDWSYSSPSAVDGHTSQEEVDSFTSSFDTLNSLEVAAVVGAKKFLSQRVVQRIIESIWKGDIVFWETLSVDSIKEAKVYDKRKADPFCRLRVPRYLKAFEALFFLSFLALYYAVLVPIQRNGHDRSNRPGVPPLETVNGTLHIMESERQRNFHHITIPEVFLFIWIAGFAYDEFGEYLDAGRAFYATDFWSLWDIGIVTIGVAFFVTRIVGIVKGSDETIGAAFDILALQALLLVPRTCSILSLNPYFGTLIPCLREMTKDFIKFLSLVVILYRKSPLLLCEILDMLIKFQLEMSWVLVKVFFGSSYLGFDVAQEISPALGPPLMLVFITMTNILLITSLISLLSNSLTRILDHAREEYLFMFEPPTGSSTSNRLTYFFPPMVSLRFLPCSPAPSTVIAVFETIRIRTCMNLIPLFLRPLRLCISQENLRWTRIVLLKITHSPYVAAIYVYEGIHDRWFGGQKIRGSASLGGPVSHSKKRDSYLRYSAYTPRTLVASSLNQASTARAGRSATSLAPRPTTRASVEPQQEDLKSLVMKLSDQVQDLTAIVAGQQQQGGDHIDGSPPV